MLALSLPQQLSKRRILKPSRTQGAAVAIAAAAAELAIASKRAPTKTWQPPPRQVSLLEEDTNILLRPSVGILLHRLLRILTLGSLPLRLINSCSSITSLMLSSTSCTTDIWFA